MSQYTSISEAINDKLQIDVLYTGFQNAIGQIKVIINKMIKSQQTYALP